MNLAALSRKKEARTALVPLIAVIAAGLALPALGAVVFNRWTGARRTASVRPAADLARDRPLTVRPLVSRLVPVTKEDMGWIHRQIQVPREIKIHSSYCLHLLRVHGLEERLERGRFSRGRDIVALLTDDRAGAACLGGEPLIPTYTGARFPTKGSREKGSNKPWLETHRDQTLAAFGELGLPLSLRLTVAGKASTLRDVLRDSIAEFHLGQDEIVWTAMAYALYLPPTRDWINRYGEPYSFDQLVIEMLNRSLNSVSCGGTHLLYALSLLERCDREVPVLSAPVRERLGQYLERCVAVLQRTQRADGSWAQDWNRELLPPSDRLGLWPVDTAGSRMLITSHLGEWLLYLRDGLRPPDDTLNRVGVWLAKALRGATEGDQEREVCPYSHAVCTLRQVAFVP
jgi:hypothetical protein